ncbi:Sulfite reductase (NADPH) [Pirellula staleyi DSM 6068]|uniref:Sulfite reductase (NADPH) n=1 Tax=Pirellula staleyi (strain ATCC 27377 / DSM 6068 / ICPB 4128) TaxID=530564 RepID=D2QWD2_PIRSD|nr:NADPH-dependent assimilatory sulfite reductase hemoprotein subunit [Pirellula staleyi]ADB16007.1 Sulfite reductase (NADPH) [Pirellula staleyi DSM 6068]
MSDTGKLSPVETIKDNSNFLAGDLTPEMTDGNDFFGKSSEVLLKFHGTYQQDDRDERGGVTEDGKKKKSFIFMVRTRIPGGKLTSQQLLEELDLCDQLGNTTLRITTRQALQLHGILKSNLKETIKRINDCQLSTLAACGDVNRNVMCCPAPYAKNIYRETQALADQIALHFAPRTKAYHETWLTDTSTGEKIAAGGAAGQADDGFDVEPIYGKHYMPRKFKMAIGFDFDNCVDLYANDLGLMAITDGDKIVGYNVLVGGGFGVTPSAKKTFPAVAKKLCFATPENVVAVVEAVFKVQRDFGNREDRKVARLKYVVANWGIEKFKAKVDEYYGSVLPEPHPTDVHGFNDHMGWDEQGDGNWFYGLNVENGRIKDTAEMQLKTAIREILTTYNPGVRLTSHQSILFTDIKPADRAGLEAILKKYGVKLTEEVSAVRRWSMACVAWPTCGLSITESERALPGMIDQLEVELAKLGLSSEKFTVRMTGCPNGCARPYNSDIGLVGRARGQYSMFLGGRLLGDRLNYLYKDYVPAEEVVSTLVPVFTYFKQSRQNGETLGDFCHRVGQADLAAFAEKFTAAAAT